LHSHAVSGQKEEPLLFIPKSKTEHALQLGDNALPTFLIEMDNDFGVSAGAKPVALGDQEGPQLLVVIDLAVVDDPNGFVLIADRLLSTAQVDDLQPSMAQP